MKQIKAVSIWQNGQNVQAIYLKAGVQTDNLSTFASFFYFLLDADFNTLTSGLVEITGKDYDNYQTNPYAWDYIAKTLGLTITGEYIPPTETPIETITETPTPKKKSK
jgi:hypothetical protein